MLMRWGLAPQMPVLFLMSWRLQHRGLALRACPHFDLLVSRVRPRLREDHDRHPAVQSWPGQSTLLFAFLQITHSSQRSQHRRLAPAAPVLTYALLATMD